LLNRQINKSNLTTNYLVWVIYLVPLWFVKMVFKGFFIECSVGVEGRCYKTAVYSFSSFASLVHLILTLRNNIC